MILRLRPLLPDDAEALLAFERANRAWFESWVNARDPGYYDPLAIRAAIAQAQDDRAADRGYQFLALDDERIVGRVNLTHVRRGHYESAELGYRIGQADAGRGIATRAVALCLGHAFGELGLWRVAATARPENGASLRVLARNGFVVFGQSRRSMRLGDRWFDVVYLERHRDGALLTDAGAPPATPRP